MVSSILICIFVFFDVLKQGGPCFERFLLVFIQDPSQFYMDFHGSLLCHRMPDISLLFRWDFVTISLRLHCYFVNISLFSLSFHILSIINQHLHISSTFRRHFVNISSTSRRHFVNISSTFRQHFVNISSPGTSHGIFHGISHGISMGYPVRYPMGYPKGYTYIPWDIPWISHGISRGISHGMSHGTKCQRNVDEICTKCRRNVHELLTKCWRNLQILPNYQRNMKEMRK